MISLTNADTVQDVQVSTLMFVITLPRSVSADPAAVPGLRADTAGDRSQERGKAVVAVTGVEGGKEHAAEGGLPEQNLPLLHNLCRPEISTTYFII